MKQNSSLLKEVCYYADLLPSCAHLTIVQTLLKHTVADDFLKFKI